MHNISADAIKSNKFQMVEISFSILDANARAFHFSVSIELFFHIQQILQTETTEKL